MLPEPPVDVLELVGPTDSWELVDPTNDRPHLTWLTERHAIKSVPSADRATLSVAADNARWLGEFVSTATVELAFDGDERSWLVTKRLPGVPAHRPDLHGDVGSLAEVAGNALRALHALPLDVAPSTTDQGWAALADLADATVAAGVESVDEPYERYTPPELLELWRSGRPSAEDLVICHGDPSLPNMMAHQGVFTGWIDMAGVRIADRHLDLATAHLSVQRNLGPEAVYVFYDTYGTDPDLLRLDHYLLARQLLP